MTVYNNQSKISNNCWQLSNNFKKPTNLSETKRQKQIN